MKKKLILLVALCNFAVFAVTPVVTILTPIGNLTKPGNFTTYGHGVGAG